MKNKEWTFVDKSGWGEGPWLSEPDKIQWVDEDTGLDCLIVRNHGVTGALCGYVGVDKNHPWHNIDYSECTENCGEKWCDHSPYSKIQVHGGLTYSNHCREGDKEQGICHIEDNPDKPDTLYWFGFDCAHAWDLSPAMNAHLAKYGRSSPIGREETYRDVAYVKQEVKNLAKQLSAIKL